MRHVAIAALLEDLEKTQNVGRDICVGPLEGVPNPGLGGKVDDAIELAAVK